MNRRRRARCVHGPLLLALALVACTSEGGDEPSAATGLRCGLVAERTGQHLVDGDEVELLKGYQGYMLVQVRAHVWGDVPRDVQVKLSGGRDGFDPLVTVVGTQNPAEGSDSHRTTTPLEVWLSPPNPSDFVGRTGALTVEVRKGALSCAHSVRVTFVDRTYCVHYDDGTVVCP